ncbi:acetyltransferase [Intrasporangium oryzae NRRL B-24470]|uniref:Acetyltransferase n=1 Tax=Intrasporangium oryzae NRRL B-24470 TaxID=1386089 RepID=W9G5P9_9MICO|nr:N-acetyltransferase [Intrasporangium oryzae]EWT00108.1 acetyltransferase [Intrasporangium oryzae NRRL B-24470]
MSEEPRPVEVVDNPSRGRYELRDGGRMVGHARYVVVAPEQDGTERVVFFHTEVDADREGQGLAARLAAFALDATIARQRTIVPVCPYIAAYVKRHREPYAAHVAAPTPADLAAVRTAAQLG